MTPPLNVFMVIICQVGMTIAIAFIFRGIGYWQGHQQGYDAAVAEVKIYGIDGKSLVSWQETKVCAAAVKYIAAVKALNELPRPSELKHLDDEKFRAERSRILAAFDQRKASWRELQNSIEVLLAQSKK